MIIAEAVGIGFLGRHAVAVATALKGWVPEILGFESGVLYQYLDGLVESPVAPEIVADYVTARARSLPVPADRSTPLRGRRTVIEVATELVGASLRRADVLARLPLVHPVVEQLLRVEEPSIVDGNVERDYWVASGDTNDPGSWRKVDFADSFTNRELLCYDAVYDVASPLDTDPAVDRRLSRAVRSRWEESVGRAVDPERWLLYRLVHAWRLRRAGASQLWFTRHASTAMQDYVAEVFLFDLDVRKGPWCALDVDGVLEIDTFGASAPGTAAAMALRGLVAHDYRVIIATGRSVSDVRDRCEAWPLAGGVAEYGSALVLERGERVVDLRTAEQAALMERVRTLLSDRSGIVIDPDYRHIVRAFRLDAGERRSLDREDLTALYEQLGRRDLVQVVPGQCQSDITPAGCTKATGTRRAARAARSGGDGGAAAGVRDWRRRRRPAPPRARDDGRDAAPQRPARRVARLRDARLVPGGTGRGGHAIPRAQPGRVPRLHDRPVEPLDGAVRTPLGARRWSCRRTRAADRCGLRRAPVARRIQTGAAGVVGVSEDDRVSTEPNGNGLRSRVVAQMRVPLLRNAYSLVSSTIANAALGLVFWVVAARVFHPTVVGRDSSLIAAMTFVSVLAQLNLNNGFNRFVPTAGHETRRLVLAGYAAAISLSLLAAGVFLLGIHVWTPRLGYLDHHPYEAAWFVVATMIWTVFVLEDSVLIGLGEAHWVLVENSIFGVIKVGALVVIATQIHRYGIFLAWTAPTILLVIPVNWFLFRKAIPRRSDHEPLENLDAHVIARFVGPDFAAQMVRTATTSLTPIIVLAIAGSSATAYAAVASMVGYTLYLLIINMGASLVTEASRAPERLAEYTRKLLSHCFGIVVPLALVLAISAHYVLSLFGEEYAERATVLLQLMALSAIPNVIVATYTSVARVQRRMGIVVATVVGTSGAVLVLLVVLLKAIGLDGVGLAWLIGQTGAAVVILLTGFRFLWVPGARPPARAEPHAE